MCKLQTPRDSSLARSSSSSRGSPRTPSRSPSGNATSGYTGDSNQRVTVAMPGSMHELEKRVGRLFGDRGKVKMFHHGTTPITNAAEFARVGHGDVIVITVGDEKLTAGEMRTLLTTNQAEYIKHSLPQIQTRSPKVHVPVPSLPFEGKSAYKSDFPEHPVLAQARHQREEFKPSNEPTGRSAYADQYRWNDVQPVSACRPPPAQRNLAAFDGKTSYSMDYVKVSAPPQPRSSSARRPAPYAPRPFEGTSTYASEFKELPMSRAYRVREVQEQHVMQTGSFAGVTEYNHEFIKKDALLPKMIHLEPELAY